MKRRSKTSSIGEIQSPTLSQSTVTRADWFEITALISPSHSVSVAELRKLLDVGDTVDAQTESEIPSGAVPTLQADQMTDEMTETVCCEVAADETYNEVSRRLSACGDSRYPFEISDGSICLPSGAERSVYVFLLLLSIFGEDDRKDGVRATKLFEELCAEVLREFLNYKMGEVSLVSARVFGFPRRMTKDGFCDALDSLCSSMAEGIGHKNRPDSNDQKDAALDLVAWRDFADKRSGKLIFFGQCAAGKNWRDKLLELPPTEKWCSYYMRERPAMLPLRAFLVPHSLDDKYWLKACYYGDLVFDRCRIVSYCRNIESKLRESIQRWTERQISRLRRS